MNPPNDVHRMRLGLGCLIAIAIAVAVVVGIAAMMSTAQKAARRDSERKMTEWRNEAFQKVKSGDDGSGVEVYRDPRLIEMLASDADCVANLTTLNLSMVDLNGPQTAAAVKLVNVKKILFYDCRGPESILTPMKGSGSIVEIGFDATLLSDDGVRLLAHFPNLKRVHFAWINEPAREKLLRDTLPGVEIQTASMAPAG